MIGVNSTETGSRDDLKIIPPEFPTGILIRTQGHLCAACWKFLAAIRGTQENENVNRYSPDNRKGLTVKPPPSAFVKTLTRARDTLAIFGRWNARRPEQPTPRFPGARPPTREPGATARPEGAAPPWSPDQVPAAPSAHTSPFPGPAGVTCRRWEYFLLRSCGGQRS